MWISSEASIGVISQVNICFSIHLWLLSNYYFIQKQVELQKKNNVGLYDMDIFMFTDYKISYIKAVL